MSVEITAKTKDKQAVIKNVIILKAMQIKK